jgi:hypothetical protein
MIRIFTTLAIVAVLLMATALLLGLNVGNLYDSPDADTRNWATVHRLVGLGTALVVVLVNSIVMTYFIGTSRWCKEVSETYGLDSQYVRRSTQLKRRAFPWAVLSMLTVIAVGSLGAAADPATRRLGTEFWTTPHLIGAFAGLIFVTFAFFMEGGRIAAHHAVIEEIMAEVRRIRQERGLQV